MNVPAFADMIHADKYRAKGEDFNAAMSRVAAALTDTDEEYHTFRNLLIDRIFLPAGRIQSAMGSPRLVTAVNCFVSGTIEDSMEGIMRAATDAAQTMRKGGGDGFDFSPIRPKGSRIASVDSTSSGVIPFMNIFDAVCGTVKSAGHRQGAMMGILRIDHPDIYEFILSKNNTTNLTNFNISVAVTDEFMRAVMDGDSFDLRFNGVVYETVDARNLYETLMRSTWDWAEPGVIFIDTINRKNNLWYCEDIAATNPCGEQVLPPHGACVLGSINLTQIRTVADIYDIMPSIVRAMDNVIDRTEYPLKAQEEQAKFTRRIGIGVTGMANHIETKYGYAYGSPKFVQEAAYIFAGVKCAAYEASIDLAEEKGCFPGYMPEYLESRFIQSLPTYIHEGIKKYGIRNSHLISYAPTGTISLTAGNVSSGIEPVFSYEYDRTIIGEDGVPSIHTISDYAYRTAGVKGRTADQCSIADHLAVHILATEHCDSAVSKTVNVGDDVSWEEFKGIYKKAWLQGAKGITTFRAAGKRFGVLNKKEPNTEEAGGACYIDPVTGDKECS